MSQTTSLRGVGAPNSMIGFCQVATDYSSPACNVSRAMVSDPCHGPLATITILLRGVRSPYPFDLPPVSR